MRRFIGGGLLLISVAVGCAKHDVSEDSSAIARQDLTASDLARIFSFEGTIGGSGDWRPSTGTAVSSTDQKADGTHSMAISGSASVSVVSTALSAVGPVGSSLGLEVWLPSALVGQNYKGTVQVFFNSTSLQLYNKDTASVRLDSLTPGQFSHVTIPLDATTSQKLSQASYSDLTITLVFGLANTTSKTYVDKLAFASPSAGGMGGASTGGTTGGTGGTSSVSTGGSSSLGGSTAAGGTIATYGGNSTGIGGAGATAGSAGSSEATGIVYQFSFQLPPGVDRNQLALATTAGDLFVDDGVTVASGSGFASVSAVAGGKVNRIGVSSHVQNLYSGGDVTLANYAEVHGDLETTGIVLPQTGAKLDGAVSEHDDLVPLQTISWSVSFPTVTQQPINLTGAQPYPPGAYPDIDIKNQAKLTLTPGTYTFNSMIVEPGGTLHIENTAGPVFIYLRDGFTFRGILSTATSQANVLFGIAGTSAVVIERPFKGIVVAPSASLSLATAPEGHQGAFFAKSITAHQNTTITLVAFEPSNFCTASDPCTSFCGCATAANPCGTDLTCASGLTCGKSNGAAYGYPDVTNVCWSTACGTVGQNSVECGRYPKGCQSDTDCPSGQVCGAANGANFDYMATRVCWPTTCVTDPTQVGCGSVYSVCGRCPNACTPNCAGKKCGDSGDDGCGGICTGYCNDGTAGCKSDAECKAGSVCSPDAAPYYGQANGQLACWPVQCQKKTPAERACGTTTSACGTVCPNESTACTGRQCGPDPLTGKSCGTCSAGQWCSGDGTCTSKSVSTGPNVPLDVAAPTDVGAITASLQITQTGRARYSVPLQVPPGVNGLTPSLSLEYIGELREGEVGIGWTIGGLSSITRCHKSNADGGPTGIDYTEDDPKYCLDRIPLVRVSPDGVFDGAEYRTEFDSQVRVIRHYARTPSDTDPLFGPNYFEVRTPDGRVSYYGGSFATGNYGKRLGSPDGSHFDWVGSRRVWALQRTEDPQGNRIEYDYEEHADGTFAGTDQTVPAHEAEQLFTAWASHPQIAQITYGGNAANSGNRTITFTRERLWDDTAKWGAVRFGWNAGAPFSVDNRVTKISLSYEGQELRNYQLQYAAGARSHLTKLFECALGHCKQPTTFSYKHFEVSMLPLPTDASDTDALAGQSLNAIHSVLDADGDGRNDLLLNPVLDPLLPADCAPKTDEGRFKFASATGNRSHPYAVSTIPNIYQGAFRNCEPASASDLDNDGKTEIYLPTSDSSHTSVYYVLRHQPNGTWAAALSGSELPFGTDYDGDGRLEQRPNTSLFDIDTDGDGVANQVDLGPSTSSTETPFLAVYSPAGSNNWSSLGVLRPEPTMSAAQTDAFIRESISVPESCYDWDIWGCTKWFGPIPIRVTCTRKTYKPACDYRGYSLKYWASSLKVLDVNGDGLKDLVTWDVTSSQTEVNGPSTFMNVWYNTGRNHFVRQPVATGLPTTSRDTLSSFLNSGVFHQAFAYDINRDGSQELILIDPVARDVYALGAGGYYQDLQLSLIQPHGSLHSIPQWFTEKSRTLVLDVDSNGVPDVLFGEGPKVAVAYGEMPEYGLLESVTDGNGRTDTLSYNAGRARADHTPGDVHYMMSAPALVLPPTVVSHTTTASGEGTRTEDYSYEDGRVGYHGRGFLGFTGVDKQVRVKRTPTDASPTLIDEHTYYRPDSSLSIYPGAHAQTLYMYYEAGRPWKRVVTTLGVSSGLGSSARLVNRTVTETRTLKPMLSDVYVPMWLPLTDTVVTSDQDSGTETIISTVNQSYEFDQYAQPKKFEYVRTRSDGTVDESSKTTITYKRNQAFLDRWLLSLVEGITTVATNATESFTRTDERDYYPDGKLATLTSEPDDTDLTRNTIFNYNDRGNLLNVVESASGVTRETDFFYDSAGDLLQYTLNPLLQSKSFAHFRGYGQLAGIQDPNGLIESRRIDAFGREIQRTDANGVTVETSYEFPGLDAGFLTSTGREVVMAVRTKGTGLPTILSFYDHYGRYIGKRYSDDDAVVRQSQVFYDVLGRRTSGSHLPFTDGGQTEYLDEVTYDNLNRPISASRASDVGLNHHASLVVKYGHPSEVSGIPAAIQASAVSAVRTTFWNTTSVTKLLDAHGRTVAMVDRNGAVLTYAYSPMGQLRYFTDAAGVTVENRYDAYGRPTYTSDPIRGISTTTYTPLGDTVVRSTPTGGVTQHYDLLGRPVDETSPEGTTTWSYDTGPGAVGRLVEVDGPPTPAAPLGHRVHYGYGPASDPVGNRGQIRNVTSTIAGESFAVEFIYDNLARVKTIQYPSVGGKRYAVSQLYSWGGRMRKVDGDDGTSSQTLWEMMTIDSLGRETSERALGAMTTDYKYTSVEGLIQQLTTSESSAERLQLTYAYDIEDNVQNVTWRENGTLSGNSRFYEYDSSGRLVGEYAGDVSSGGLTKGTALGNVDYLPNGNINSKLDVGTYVYGSSNPYAVTAVGGNSYEYDGIGRQTTRTGPVVAGGHMDLTWTSFDSPNTVTLADGSSIRYEYNGLKQKVLEVNATQRKILVGGLYQRVDNLVDGTSRHSIVVQANGRRVAEITLEESAAGVVAAQPAAAVVSDRLGSAIVTRMSATDYALRQYAGFGKASGAPATPSGEGYAGYVQDDNLGLTWMNNRLYDPTIGRVLAADPVIAGSFGQDGANRYAYVYNRPTSLTDVTGLAGDVVTCPGFTVYGEQVMADGMVVTGTSPTSLGTTDVSSGQSATIASSSPVADVTRESPSTETSTTSDLLESGVSGGLELGGPAGNIVAGVFRQAETNSWQNKLRQNPLELRHNITDWTGFAPPTPVQASASASVDTRLVASPTATPAKEVARGDCPLDACAPPLYGENIQALGQVKTDDSAEMWKSIFLGVTILAPAPELGLFAGATRGAIGLTKQSGGALLRAATQLYKGGSLTNAGRALTKHPEILGYTKDTLRQAFSTDAALNAAAEGAVGGILSSGTATIKDLARYGATIEVSGGSGFGARWVQETGEFIGFINP